MIFTCHRPFGHLHSCHVDRAPWPPTSWATPGYSPQSAPPGPVGREHQSWSIFFFRLTLVRFLFFSLKKEVARPRLPIRPVLPILKLNGFRNRRGWTNGKMRKIPIYVSVVKSTRSISRGAEWSDRNNIWHSKTLARIWNTARGNALPVDK